MLNDTHTPICIYIHIYIHIYIYIYIHIYILIITVPIYPYENIEIQSTSAPPEITWRVFDISIEASSPEALVGSPAGPP